MGENITARPAICHYWAQRTNDDGLTNHMMVETLMKLSQGQTIRVCGEAWKIEFEI